MWQQPVWMLKDHFLCINYKYILSNLRYNFEEHNLEMYIIINFNS